MCRAFKTSGTFYEFYQSVQTMKYIYQTSFSVDLYCLIITDHGGPMFVDFVGHPYPQMNMILFYYINNKYYPYSIIY
jgi:hypothetical protein